MGQIPSWFAAARSNFVHFYGDPTAKARFQRFSSTMGVD
jgi:hypothetical protein